MAETRLNPDWSTINLKRLKALPRYRLPRTYSLSEPGHCCEVEPPGHPSYYLRSVYGKRGLIDKAPRRVILHEGVLYIVEKYQAFADLTKGLAPLWLPLAIDHPRTVAWMQSIYAYLGRYIFDESRVWEVVGLVRRYYPEHELILEWVENPPKCPGRWWQSASRRPWPKECPA